MKQEKGRTAAFEDVGKKVLRTATALVEQKAREQLGREGLEHNLGNGQQFVRNNPWAQVCWSDRL